MPNLDQNKNHIDSNPELIRLKLKADGPEPWRAHLVDMDTGKILPVKKITYHSDHENNIVWLEARILIYEADVQISEGEAGA